MDFSQLIRSRVREAGPDHTELHNNASCDWIMFLHLVGSAVYLARVKAHKSLVLLARLKLCERVLAFFVSFHCISGLS